MQRIKTAAAAFIRFFYAPVWRGLSWSLYNGGIVSLYMNLNENGIYYCIGKKTNSRQKRSKEKKNER